MKINIIANLCLSFLLLIVISACKNEPENIQGESPYRGEALSVSGRQVWTTNKYATKISQTYISYNGNHEIDVTVPIVNIDSPNEYISKKIGLGFIDNGIFSFSVDNRIKTSLLDWDEFKMYFFHWKDTAISAPGTKGNVLVFYAYPAGGNQSDGLMDLQKITGASKSITQEVIIFLYVNNDCVISGKSNSNFIPDKYYYYTEGDLYLPLKKGLNLIISRETYGINFSGSAHIAMEIRNPIQDYENFKWVLELGYTF